MTLMDKLNEENIPSRFKSLVKTGALCLCGMYVGLEISLFGLGLIQEPGMMLTSPKDSKLYLEYINKESSTLTKFALVGYTVAQMINVLDEDKTIKKIFKYSPFKTS